MFAKSISASCEMLRGSKNLFIAIAVSLMAYGIVGMMLPEIQARFVGMIALLIFLWTNDGLPLGVTSLLPIVLFPALGILGTDAMASNYSKSIIFLFLGGFMLAIGAEKIGLHKIISQKILSVFPKTKTGMIAALGLTSAILSTVLSNTTTALLLIPIAMFLTDNTKLRSRFALAIAFGSSIGGVLTPIGTPPNLIMLGFLKERGLEVIPFMKWVLLLSPLVAVMFVSMVALLSLGLRDTILSVEKTEIVPAEKRHRQFLYYVGALIVLLFINSPMGSWAGLGLDEKSLFLGAGLLLFLPFVGIMNWNDMKKIPYDVIFLFGAGFAIAQAFDTVGFSKLITEKVGDFGGMPLIAILFLIALLISFATGITSNTALAAVVLPVIYSFATASGGPTYLYLMTATICTSFAFLLPISTPPNAIAMASGAVTTRTMAKFGIALNLIGVFWITLISVFFWSHFI